MSTLRTLIANHPTLAEELPLIHTSRGDCLAGITACDALQPQPCSVFGESLVYLFYGRPAYRSPHGTKAGEPIALCPVCFVFKPRMLSGPLRRVFPCDSGAVAMDRFLPEVAATDLKELELEPHIDSARKAVSLLFDTNTDYFFGKAVIGRTFAAGSIEQRFYDLLLRPGPADYDDRKSAVEIQVGQAIPLTDSLLFVVLPKEFLEEAAIRDAIINTWNCDPVCYSTFQGAAPAEYYSVVRHEVAKRFGEAHRI